MLEVSSQCRQFNSFARRTVAVAGLIGAFALAPSLRGEIYRWDTGELIVGTEGITPRPRLDFGRQRPSLEFADFTGANLVASAVDEQL